VAVAAIAFAESRAAEAQTREQQWKSCAEMNQPDISIGGCTAIIQSGRETPDILGIAFYDRGTAYSQKGQFDHAIQDYNRAIGLNPDYANAFYNRGLAYDEKGQFDLAIQDYNQAVSLKSDHADAFTGLCYARASAGLVTAALV